MPDFYNTLLVWYYVIADNKSATSVSGLRVIQARVQRSVAERDLAVCIQVLASSGISDADLCENRHEYVHLIPHLSANEIKSIVSKYFKRPDYRIYQI